MAVVTLNIHHRGLRGCRVPPLIRTIVLGYLAKYALKTVVEAKCKKSHFYKPTVLAFFLAWKRDIFCYFQTLCLGFFMTKYSRLALFFRVVFLRFDEELEHEKLLHNSQDPKSNNLPLEESTKLGKAKLYPTSAPASSGTSAVASSQVCYNSSILPMIDGVNQQSKKLQMILCMPLSSLLYTVSLFSLVACGLLFCKAILSSINQVVG